MNERDGGRFLAAAIEVLRSTGRPMTSREITQTALAQGLISTSGKTPERTMRARLYVMVRSDPACPIKRLFETGASRARRGSVRWVLRQPTE